MVHPILRIAVIAAVCVLGSRAALSENRVALVIGQSAYRTVTPLPNPANDAKVMAGLLTAAGFDVTAAPDLTQNDLRQAISDFAAKVATKGSDTVALVFYAGHGVQIDGENYLVPVDVNLARELDVPLQSVRLNDLMNALASVPSKTRIIMLDACRNNPFGEINKTAGHGLAIVDVRAGAAGTFISYSTSPGMEALDGGGANSPYTTALLTAAKEPGLPIEEAFKRVRVSVNKVTDGQQTPWESSSLVGEFYFFPGAATVAQKPASIERTTADWRAELASKPVTVAYEIVIGADTIEAYEAFAALYPQALLAPRVRALLERRREMTAWSVAVILNTVVSYQAFLTSYPNSDLAQTARKLQERVLNRVPFGPVADAGGGGTGNAPNGGGPAAPSQGAGAPAPGVQNAALSGPMCPCVVPPVTPIKRADTPPAKKVDTPPPTKKVEIPPPPRKPVVQRQPTTTTAQPARGYDPNEAAAAGVIMGIGAGMLMRGGRGYGGRGGYEHGD
jgi:hypothetical protein